MNKSELINDSLIELNVEAQSKEEALKKVADLVLKAGCVKSAAAYYHGMMEREKNSTTGFGSGIAIPHAKMEEVVQPAICVITLKDAIDWKAMDNKPVQLLIALAVPTEHEGSFHLKLLATLSENLMEDHFVQSLLSARTKHEILTTITGIFTDKGEV
ncbi:PTS sugar transporter subunit IIA [Oceanobacillus sp. FSL W8-0428]|uniref:fructose PTS transporter subunit IIA n=1 Tax=Oceanobacillus sp. FSL W8-0428 TaxID=2921715 RepID=UPI0012EE3CC7